jgi:ABC-2 type transport system ATP-binding protein
MTNAIITINALDKRYPGTDKKALDAASIEIQQGAFFGLLGPNGSGKTTLISILCGLLKADKGTATICGYDALNDAFKIKSKIGLVPQKLALYPTLTLSENLCLMSKLYGLTDSVYQKRLAQCLEIVELKDVANQLISTYSGGMARRANLAMALLHSPDILFLDEPTVNVDAHARNMIFNTLKKINASGVTIIYTTHYLEEVETLCTDMAILNQGKIVIHDTVQHILQKHPILNSLSEVYLALTETDN